MSRSRYKFGDEHYPHFMTDTIVAWLPVFSYPCFADTVFESWRFLQRERQILLLAFVVMENHLHWVAVGPDLGKRVKEFKSYTARNIVATMKRNGYETLLRELKFFKRSSKLDQDYQLWQEGSHPKAIENDNTMWQKIEYTHNNPLRRGFVDDPLHWRYSSARNYAGQPGLIDVCTDWM